MKRAHALHSARERMRTLHASLKSKANYAKSLCYRSPLWLHVGHNMEVTEISQQLSVSQSSVYRYIELFKRTGDVRPKSYRHGPPKLLGDMEQLFLLKLILNYPGIYLSELQAKLFIKYDVTVNVSTICRTLKFMGCSRQVIQRNAVMSKGPSLWQKYPCMTHLCCSG